VSDSGLIVEGQVEATLSDSRSIEISASGVLIPNQAVRLKQITDGTIQVSDETLALLAPLLKGKVA